MDSQETKQSFVEILAKLAEPFPAKYVEWKPQSTSGNKCMAVAFVDPRHYMKRLDTVCPEWGDTYGFPKADATLVMCALRIGNITRCDVGECDEETAAGKKMENIATSAAAQAFKRACAKFGLGRYLYFLPDAWVDYDPEKRRILKNPTLPSWAVPKGEAEETPSGNGSKAKAAAPLFAEYITVDANRKAWWAKAKEHFRLGEDDIYDALGCEHLTEYTGSVEGAWAELAAYAAERILSKETVAVVTKPAPAPELPPMDDLNVPAPNFCNVHKVEMQKRGPEGKSWYSHKTDEG